MAADLQDDTWMRRPFEEVAGIVLAVGLLVGGAGFAQDKAVTADQQKENKPDRELARPT